MLLPAATPDSTDAQLASSIQTMLEHQRQQRQLQPWRPATNPVSRNQPPQARTPLPEPSRIPNIGRRTPTSTPSAAPSLQAPLAPAPLDRAPQSHHARYPGVRQQPIGNLNSPQDMSRAGAALGTARSVPDHQATVRVYWSPEVVKVWEPYLSHSLNPFSKPRTRYRLVEKTVLRPHREVIPDRWRTPPTTGSRQNRSATRQDMSVSRPSSKASPSKPLMTAAEIGIPLSEPPNGEDRDSPPLRR
jgi:hypothetical protein